MLSEHGLRSYRLTGAYCIDNNPIRNGTEDMCFIGDSQIASTSVERKRSSQQIRPQRIRPGLSCAQLVNDERDPSCDLLFKLADAALEKLVSRFQATRDQKMIFHFECAPGDSGARLINASCNFDIRTNGSHLSPLRRYNNFE